MNAPAHQSEKYLAVAGDSTRKTSSKLTRMTLYLAIGLVLTSRTAEALTCYETNEDGDMVEVSSDEFTYCTLLPERVENNKYVEGKAFGVGPASDSTTAYDRVFDLNNQLYQVLSMCIYERYDFGKVSPKFSFKQPEFMLRCFCNYDLCNREKNFFGYINHLKAESANIDTKHLPEAKL